MRQLQKIRFSIRRKNDCQVSVLLKQPPSISQQIGIRKGVGMTRQMPVFIGIFQGVNKVRRIAYDEMVRVAIPLLQTAASDLQMFRPRRAVEIVRSLSSSGRINVNCIRLEAPLSGCAPLCEHKRNESRPCSDIQDAQSCRILRQGTPCAQKYAIGADFHGTPVVPDSELLKAEEGRCHCQGCAVTVSGSW